MTVRKGVATGLIFGPTCYWAFASTASAQNAAAATAPTATLELQQVTVTANFIRPGGQSAGLALILGIDRFMSEARALTNMIGNGVGAIVVAAWEGDLDRNRLRSELAIDTGRHRALALHPEKRGNP